MRNLDLTNPDIFKTERIASLGAIIPIFFSLLGIALADAAAPSVPFIENPVTLFNCTILIAAFILIFLPKINKWGWETKHFGVSLFNLLSITLICLTPCLCIVFFSALPFPLRILVLTIYLAAHALWCRRFMSIYKEIYADSNTINLIYQEEHDAIYYMQKIDKAILDKKYKFTQIPKSWYFLVSNILSFFLLVFPGLVKTTTALPFIHSFLFINSFPISIMAVGLATKSGLVFYYYPAIIKKRTSKNTYVDMSSKLPKGEIF